MSKRNSLGNTSGTNTLFKYFTKSPAASPQTPQQSRITAPVASNTTPKSSFSKDRKDDKGHSNKKASVDRRDRDNEDDSPIIPVKPKRLRLIDSDSESDRENEDNNVQSVDPVPKVKASRAATSEPSSPQPKKKMKREPKELINFEEKLKTMKVQDVHDVHEEIDDEPVLWFHNKLDFLKPENIKDMNGHRPDHPDYNPKTLLVPKSFLDKLTPVRFFMTINLTNNFEYNKKNNFLDYASMVGHEIRKYGHNFVFQGGHFL